MQDELQWKTTFSGRHLLMEDILQMRTTFVGRWPSIKCNLQWIFMEGKFLWRTTFSGRQPLMEYDFYWRKPLMENDHQWKTTFNRRLSSMGDNLQCKTIFGWRKQRSWTEQVFSFIVFNWFHCQTRLYLGFSANLRIWQISSELANSKYLSWNLFSAYLTKT